MSNCKTRCHTGPRSYGVRPGGLWYTERHESSHVQSIECLRSAVVAQTAQTSAVKMMASHGRTLVRFYDSTTFTMLILGKNDGNLMKSNAATRAEHLCLVLEQS